MGSAIVVAPLLYLDPTYGQISSPLHISLSGLDQVALDFTPLSVGQSRSFLSSRLPVESEDWGPPIARHGATPSVWRARAADGSYGGEVRASRGASILCTVVLVPPERWHTGNGVHGARTRRATATVGRREAAAASATLQRRCCDSPRGLGARFKFGAAKRQPTARRRRCGS